jgi:hypothetical protein
MVVIITSTEKCICGCKKMFKDKGKKGNISESKNVHQTPRQSAIECALYH